MEVVGPAVTLQPVPITRAVDYGDLAAVLSGAVRQKDGLLDGKKLEYPQFAKSTFKKAKRKLKKEKELKGQRKLL